MRRFLLALFRCRHPHTYRERREMNGCQVLHLVCADCGAALPAIRRSTEEQIQMTGIPAHERMQARPVRAPLAFRKKAAK